MKIFQVLLLVSVVIIFSNCNDDNSTNPDNPIDSVKIGNQVWMSKNLDVDRYRNGDLIPEIKDQAEWSNLQTGAWCYYDNKPENGAIYGKLYNWYAVNDPRGLAPEGWHVPTDAEWTVLTNYLGGEGVAGGKLKSTGTIEQGDGLWRNPNTGATNEIGFTAFPGGWRSDYGRFNYIKTDALWWSATENYPTLAWSRVLYCDYANVNRSSFSKEFGFSVRCVRD